MSELITDNISIREASLEDAKILFRLSNDVSVRENSINRDKIEWDNHLKWLRKKIESNTYHIFLFFDNKNFIGQVKFEVENKEAVISISIVNEYRGKRLAVPMLQKGIECALNKARRIEKIFAYIRPENQSSIKSFNKVGFSFQDQVEINNNKFNRYLLVFEKNE